MGRIEDKKKKWKEVRRIKKKKGRRMTEREMSRLGELELQSRAADQKE